MSLQGLGNGAAQSIGSQLTDKVLQTPQGQEALARTAKEIACGSAALVGSAVATGHIAVIAGTAVAAVAAPIVAAGAAGLGILYVASMLTDWLDS